MDGMEQPALNCDGSVYQMYGGGTWKGHVLPGLVFFVWALWWTVQIYRAHLLGIADGSGYRSRAWWPGLWHIEPLLKIFGPPLGILVELRLDHSEFLCVSSPLCPRLRSNTCRSALCFHDMRSGPNM